MPQPLYTFVQKTAAQIRDDYLRTVKNGLIAQGVANPNVGPGSDYYITGTALGNELAVVHANAVVLVDQLMPDTAGGSFLDRWLGTLGLGRRAAVPSSGVVTITASVTSVNITQDQQLVDGSGQLYEVTVGGLYGTAAGLSLYVPVQAVTGGSATNHANGDTLRWVTAPAFCAQTVSVGTTGGEDGLSGGLDSEEGVDEPPRQRLFARFQNPPKGGNWSDVAGWAEASTPDVQAAFVYPAIQGPATVQFAVSRNVQTVPPFSSTSKNRDVDATTVSGTVVPYVQGQLPEHVYSAGYSVANQAVDVALLLSLPSAPTASPPGPGGGWLDGTPWPSTVGGTAIPTVGTVTSSTVFQVVLPTGAAGPTAGVNHVSYISPNTWTLYTATVTAATFVSGTTWTITIDTPFPDVSTGAYIFPASVNQSSYFAAILQAFANLGPGEWVASASPAYTYAYRRPRPALAWPYSLDATFLRTVENAGPEVLSAQWVPSVGGGNTTPTVPANVTTAPNILVPRRIGIFAS